MCINIKLLLVLGVGLTVVGGSNNCTYFTAMGNQTLTGTVTDYTSRLNCSKFSKSGEACSPRSLPDYVDSSHFVGKPDSLMVLADQALVANGTYRSRLNISWTFPQSANELRALKGFLIQFNVLQGLGAPTGSCALIDLQGNDLSAFRDNQLTFRFDVPNMRQTALYWIQLYSLPMTNDDTVYPNVRQDIFVNTPANANGPNPGPLEWASAVSYQVNNVSSYINVTFAFAPAYLNFTHYKVLLGPRSNPDATVQTKGVSQSLQPTYGSTSFENVSPGEYVILIGADGDKYFNDPDRCLCYKTLPEEGDTRYCQACPLTRSLPFTVGGTTSHTPATSTYSDSALPRTSSTPGHLDPSSNSVTVIAAILGSFAGLALFSIMGFILWYQRKCPFGTTEKQYQLDPDVACPPKRVFLVCTEDNHFHVKAVEALARYLRDNCHCQVLFPRWERNTLPNTGLLNWTASNIDKADFIVLVNSKWSCNLVQNWKDTCSKGLPPAVDSKKDIFLVAYQCLLEKWNSQPLQNVLLTHMDYTGKNFILTEFHQGIWYELPQQLKEVAKVILQPTGSQLVKQSIPDVPKSFMEAIKQGKKYEQNNPIPMLRLDSGIGSIPEEDAILIRDKTISQQLPLPHSQYSKGPYSNDDDCITYVENEFDPYDICSYCPSSYTYGFRNLGVPEKDPERIGRFSTEHLLEKQGEHNSHVYHSPLYNYIGPARPGGKIKRSISDVGSMSSRQNPIMPNDLGQRFQQFSPGVRNLDIDNMSEFYPPLEPEALDGLSDALWQINLNSDKLDLKRDTDSCSGLSV